MGLLDFINSPAGIGLLSTAAGAMAGARQGQPWNTAGRGLTAGLVGYSQANDQLRQAEDDKFQKQLRQAQMDQMQRQLADQQKMRESLQSLYKPGSPAGVEPFKADNPFGEDLGNLQTSVPETPATFGGKPVDPVMAAVLPYSQPADIMKMFSPNSQDKTAEVRNWEFAQSLPPEQRDQFMAKSGGGSMPSTVQEWEYVSKLDPQARAQYMEMKRAPQVMNLGGYMAVRSPGGGIGESYAVAPKVTDTPGYIAAQEAAKVRTAETIKADVAAKTDAAKAAPANAKAVSSLDRLDTDIQSVIDHPGLKWAVGPASVLPIMPGTPQADAFAAIQNLADRAAVGAIQEMRAASKSGGAVGAVSEKEWPKLEAQLANMNRAQSYVQFKAELKKFQNLVRDSKQQINAAGTSKPVKKYNPETGRIE